MSLFDTTAAIRAKVAATLVGLTQGYASRAAAVAALPVDAFFDSDETGTSRRYRRTPEAPGYADLGPTPVPTKTSVGLSNVDNTSDADKPVSAAQATALSARVHRALTLVDVANMPLDRKPYLEVPGREGFFRWIPGDQRPLLATDPLSGVYLPTSTDTTPGQSGVWKRVFSGGLRPEWFGALGDNVTNDTAAFAAALLVSPNLLLDATRYRIADLILPNGAVIRGIRGKSWLMRYAGATAILNVSGKSGLVLEDFGLNGIGKSAGGISAGADGMRLRGLRFEQCQIAVGTLSNPATGAQGGYTGTTDLFDCEVVSCLYGYGNFVDSHFMGGRVTDCTNDGFIWAAGSNDNSVLGTKVEFNRGYGARITSSRNNVLRFGVVDRNSKAGARLYDCDDTFVEGVFRRNGKDVATLGADDRCHIYEEACRGLTVNILTSVGKEDDGTGDITPQYSIRIGGAAGSTTGLTVMGDVAGCTGAITISEATAGAIASDAVLVATGLDEKRISSLKTRYGRVYQTRLTQQIVAAASGTPATSQFTFLMAAIDPSASRGGALVVTIRNRTTNARSQTRIPFVIARDGGNAYVTLGNPINEVGADHIGGANLTITSSGVTAGATSLFITVSNSSATAYDLAVEAL